MVEGTQKKPRGILRKILWYGSISVAIGAGIAEVCYQASKQYKNETAPIAQKIDEIKKDYLILKSSNDSLVAAVNGFSAVSDSLSDYGARILELEIWKENKENYERIKNAKMDKKTAGNKKEETEEEYIGKIGTEEILGEYKKEIEDYVGKFEKKKK
jgi:vacuolar-type H+-ATPase subunit I/STV1